MKLPRLGFVLATVLAIALIGCNQAPATTPSATTAPKAQATQPAAPTATAATKAPTTPAAAPTTAATAPAAKAGTTPAASSGDPSTFYLKYVTAADVEKITGKSGVKQVPYDPSKGAGGSLNFATADGQVLVIFTFGDGSLYTQSKAYKGMYKADVGGIGDEAFSGPSENLFGGGAWTSDPYLIVARKGTLSFSESSFLDYGTMKPILTVDQLTALAKLIASRM